MYFAFVHSQLSSGPTHWNKVMILNVALCFYFTHTWKICFSNSKHEFSTTANSKSVSEWLRHDGKPKVEIWPPNKPAITGINYKTTCCFFRGHICAGVQKTKHMIILPFYSTWTYVVYFITKVLHYFQIYTSCSKKLSPLMFDNNFSKCLTDFRFSRNSPSNCC